MYYYQTVSEAVNELNKRGYDRNFNLNSLQISCADDGVHLRADEFNIDEVY